MLAVLGSASVTTVAGCTGGDGGSGAEGSCSPPSTDDLQSLFPSDTDTFSGQYGTSMGVDGIGTDDYFFGRYTDSDGGANGMLIAKYSSQSEAESDVQAALSGGTEPATGYLVSGQYLVLVDAQSRELGRALVQESELDSGCASQLTFDAETTGTGGGTTTETEGPTETETETETPTPEPVESSFSDGWEDGNYKENPIWFVETGGGNIEVVDVESPRGAKALEYDIENGNATVKTNDKLRFDAPWTLDTMIRFPSEIRPSSYRIRFGSGSSGFGGSNANLNIGVEIKDDGSKSRRQANASISGQLVNDKQNIEKVLRADIWYRIQVRHQGDGTYQLKLWPASDSVENATTAISKGAMPQTTEENQLPLRINGRRPKAKTTVQTEFISYRTDAAADQ